MIGLISQVKNIIASANDLFAYSYWNTAAPIKAFPALVCDIINKEYTKQVHFAQYYESNLRLGVYIIVEEKISDEKFELLIDETLNRFFLAETPDSKRYNDVSIMTGSIGHFKISGRNCKAFFTEIEFKTKEHNQ